MLVRISLALGMLAIPSGSSIAQSKVDFARDVLPILADNCFSCHGPDAKARKADLRLDVKESALEVLIPGKSAESELIRRLSAVDPDERMPPVKSNKKLSPAQIATLRSWVDQGAAWGQHWAFVNPTRPAIPTFEDPQSQAWVKNPVDAFVLGRMRREALSPSPAASRAIWLRRVTLDLTGLPPTPDDVEVFLNDQRPDAYELVVDRLLASPRYGERMAWDWLDAARYADSNGYQGDGERTMWPWRDWVVRAFNENLPFDRFTVWQLAGDLLPNPTPEQVLATAFNRNHMINGEGGRIAEENRIEYVFDQTETVGTVWLGLTLTCARCHDHKFDPIARKEYYQLFAYFNQSPVTGSGGSGQTAPTLDFGTPDQEAKLKSAQQQYDALVKKVAPIETRLREAGAVFKDGKYESTLPTAVESALRKGPNGRVDANNDELAAYYKTREPEYVTLLGELRKAKQTRDAAATVIPRVMVMQDAPKPRDTFMLNRGAYDKPEGQVRPDVPAALPALPKDAPRNRLALANWLVRPDHPLTARVTVNRLWQMLFGVGLVKTADDFGVQGERPLNPELLDWLAVEFRDSGWDVKRLLRLIATSSTYRQASRVTPELREQDPENRLTARGPRYRLPAWMIRDQALAASGLLTPTVGGPPVKTYQPAGVWEEATFGFKRYQQDRGESLYRRSLYVFWRRIVGPTIFFDSAKRQTCSVKATINNTPLHALATLNDVTYVEAARALAQMAIMTGGKSDAERLVFAFRRLTARTPTAAETSILTGALSRQRDLFNQDLVAARKLLSVGDSPREDKLDPVDHASLTAVCLLMLNLDETLTKQ